MTRDDLEFRISQYLDGTLTAPESAEIERLAAERGEVRALLEQYQKLDAALKGMPIPEMQWEALAGRLSRAVADRVAADQLGQGEETVRSYAMPWVRSRVTRWAIAASLLVVTGVGMLIYHKQHTLGTIVFNPKPEWRQPVVVIDGPVAEAPAGKPMDEVEIGPPPATVADGQSDEQGWRSSQAVVAGVPRLVIASGAATAQDNTAQLPY